MKYEGPRYVAGLRDKTDLCCYKDFFETEKFEEAKQEADAAADKNKRNTIVYDRKLMEITYRKVVQEEVKAAPPPKPQKVFRKGKAKKEEEPSKGPSKDDFFE
jgi:hypothetical protein